MDCYIYYRVDVLHQQHVITQALAMQAQITARTGLVSAVKRRPSAANGLHTWMEVYRDIPDDLVQDFELQLQAALAQTDLSKLIQGERHCEYFVDAATCA